MYRYDSKVIISRLLNKLKMKRIWLYRNRQKRLYIPRCICASTRLSFSFVCSTDSGNYISLRHFLCPLSLFLRALIFKKYIFNGGIKNHPIKIVIVVFVLWKCVFVEFPQWIEGFQVSVIWNGYLNIYCRQKCVCVCVFCNIMIIIIHDQATQKPNHSIYILQ